MRRPLVASIFVLSFISLAAAQAQQQQILPLKPPPPAPIKPYTAVAATPPQPYNDPGFQDFHKQLAEIAAKKDRAALAKLVVAQGFFWVQDKDLANKSKPGIDNLAKAIDLDDKDGSGWDALASFASDPTASELPDHKGVFCAPADPKIDSKAFQALGRKQPRPTRPNGAIRCRTASKSSAGRRPTRRSSTSWALIWCAYCLTARRRATPTRRCSCTSRRRPENPAMSRSTRSRRWAATRCATPRTPAAGKSPAISAVPRSSAAP